MTKKVAVGNSVRFVSASEITKVHNRLKTAFGDVSEERMVIIAPLLQEMAFEVVLVRKLRKHIEVHGVTERYQNGESQFGFKKSVESDMHIQHMKMLDTITNKLLAQLPREEAEAIDQLDTWLDEQERA